MKDLDALRKTKERSEDRILVLRQIEGQNTLSSSGLIDNRLFKGENRLHGVRNPIDNLWYMKYDTGGIPDPLKQKFTSFADLYRLAKGYFEKRGIEIVEVID